MECPTCESELEDCASIEASFSGEWIEIIVRCDECGQVLVGWFQLTYLEEE